MALVEVESNGPVRTVTLNRPAKRNAMNEELLEQLCAAFSDPPADDERVTVIRAAGAVFCAGMDLAQRRESLGSPATIVDSLRAIENYALPVVAVVQGHAIAGGNELALHCDFVVASSKANFGMSLSQVGLAPTWFLTKKLMEVCGPVGAREILFLGDPLSATRMHELGFIARVAEPDQLDVEAQKIIDRLAANAPLSLRMMKKTLVRQMAFRDATPYDDIDEEVRVVSTSEDAREGVSARLEKREATFKGR
jgi:enoyl-CoA hydratase/carnithine racemase